MSIYKKKSLRILVGSVFNPWIKSERIGILTLLTLPIHEAGITP
jgi:hypothetical protein